MAIDAKQVLVGAPDQSPTTGAVNVAPYGTAVPADAVTELDEGFKACGYVSEDGVTLTTDISTTDIRDWSKSVVRTLIDEFTGEVTFSFIQTGYDELCAIFGKDAVVQTPATADHGAQLSVKIGAQLAPAQCYVLNMRDGGSRIRIVLPNAQPVLDGDLVFAAGQAITWGCKLACGADAAGKSIYIHTDDGNKAVI